LEFHKKPGGYLQGPGSFQGFLEWFLNRKCHRLSPWPMEAAQAHRSSIGWAQQLFGAHREGSGRRTETESSPALEGGDGGTGLS
jgi:hypothetical protein